VAILFREAGCNHGPEVVSLAEGGDDAALLLARSIPIAKLGRALMVWALKPRRARRACACCSGKDVAT
jgi:hypothetical protein